MSAVQRIISELGIGARRITISTVGIVPNIQKLTQQHAELPQFRLAISLHSASDDERTALLPANGRNGGLNALMEALREYIDSTGRRITVEWALIAGENDTVETARQLGRLLTRHPQFPLRPDLVHVNVIPLNPTALYNGQPSRAPAVNAFCDTLQQEFGISCTPRVRRGIDIDAGCGQLTTKLREEREEQEAFVSKEKTLQDFMPRTTLSVGVYNDEDDDTDTDEELLDDMNVLPQDEGEAQRLISLIQGTTIDLSAMEDRN
jgi:adenine C2-methylase RlmN of 23S rRNA A2503 and tRNA A37